MKSCSQFESFAVNLKRLIHNSTLVKEKVFLGAQLILVRLRVACYVLWDVHQIYTRLSNLQWIKENLIHT